MKKQQNRRFLCICLVCIIVSLFSCGIEDYFYLYPVPLGNIQIRLNSTASITLPNINLQEFYYFAHFAIYYRIYISDIREAGTLQLSQSYLSRINSALSADYFAIYPYTTTNTQNTQVNTSIGAFFRNRNYYTLALEDADIENDILASSALGRTLEIDFAPMQTGRRYPFLFINGQNYNLFRSNNNGVFSPRPDRYFVNTPQLYDRQNVTSAINADVADHNIPGTYTYVSMYIVVSGIDSNFSPINSIPTFIGIFLLPDPNPT